MGSFFFIIIIYTFFFIFQWMNSGGISLKPSNNMALMKGDMGGAATVAGALYGICKLKLPVNVVAVTPLCENLPSGTATKPGDVIKAMNGKSIEVLDTDAEGRLILADALYYLSSQFKPASIIDLATLTGAMDVALGKVYAGVFTNSDDLWERLQKAGKNTSDRFWRMPLDDGYLKEMKESLVADLNNLGKGRSGGACSAAAFLKEFVDGLDAVPAVGDSVIDNKQPVAWAHIDIAGVMDCDGNDAYHTKGMSGKVFQTHQHGKEKKKQYSCIQFIRSPYSFSHRVYSWCLSINFFFFFFFIK
jgi:aminopeptidase